MKRSYRACCIPLAMLALIWLGSEARAWGQLGHQVICEIAFRIAEPQTQAAIQDLIKLDDRYKNFADSCFFADDPRQRRDEHFLNLARDANGITSDECPRRAKCVLTAIHTDFEVLSKAGSNFDRLVALKFLGHWVGDIHQPMHVSFEDDKGGNFIRTGGQCPGSLHSTWDNCLVHYAVGPDAAEAATELLSTLTPEMSARYLASGPRDWANESFAISKAAETRYCVMHGASCDPAAAYIAIGAEYFDANEAAVKRQLLKAGVRLARLLDTAIPH
jgi:hypothetical protein